MVVLHIAAFAFITVAFLGEGFGVTDEEFQELQQLVGKLIHEFHEKLKIQELENARQALVINQQGETISRLEAALITGDRKCKPEVQEPDAVQNSTIEERVSLLEIQVTDLREDVTEVDEDVTGLDQDVNFLFGEQLIQDERLLNLEETSLQVAVELAEINVNLLDIDFRVTTLEENGGSDGNSSVAELQVRVETLEGTTADHETRLTTAEADIEATETRLTAAEENIQGLQVTDVNHDERISALEENGGGSGSQNDTIAFHAALTSYDTIPLNVPVIFNEVLLNEDSGYDSTTGVFTVPPGGDGAYYFSTYVLVDQGGHGRFNVRLNDDAICSSWPDHNSNGANDLAPGSCSAVVNVVAADEVAVVLDAAPDTTPLEESTVHLYHGFNGFRI